MNDRGTLLKITAPPEYQVVRPVSTLPIARVAMSALTLSLTTSSPLPRPTSVPADMPMIAASQIGEPAFDMNPIVSACTMPST